MVTKKVVHRRTRSPHPGVVLERPRPPRTAWRARYSDPDTGRIVKARIDPSQAHTAEARRAYAVALSKRLVRRTIELEQGAAVATGTALTAAVARYYEDHPRLRPLTLKTYQKGTARFLVWADRAGVRSADDLNLAHLMAFRAWIAKAPKREAQPGGKQGAKRDADAPRAASAVNVDIRSVKVALGYLRRLGLLPRISRDDLTDGLKALSVEHERGAFLRGPELRALVEAALAHDETTFALTRADKAARRGASAVPRYQAIAPMVAAAILTGMRLGELTALEWSQVDLPAREIHLTAATKTKRARSVDLEICPALVEALGRIRPTPARGLVFGHSPDQVNAAARRLGRYGAPRGWNWQALRRTCGTFLTCAPGVFGAASVFRSARQLGHSVAIAERHYVGVLRGIDPGARTLEAAMGIADLVGRIAPADAVAEV